MERWQYLIVLGACLLVTFPLEFFGAGVYRRPWRTLRAVLPVALIFLVWDAVATAAQIWTYNPRFITGFAVGDVPVEEALFFLVIPLCGLLTYNAVNAMLTRLRRPQSRTDKHAEHR